MSHSAIGTSVLTVPKTFLKFLAKRVLSSGPAFQDKAWLGQQKGG